MKALNLHFYRCAYLMQFKKIFLLRVFMTLTKCCNDCCSKFCKWILSHDDDDNDDEVST